ncbi:UDP-glucose 4-epimerase GalE [Eisenibacter elegans]|uniref:UDP-glucose 4-epimerase GalE n=1 Tax=Eisenibacter elegans TaxID=997 RepID=UPI0004157326|nr:UDP-glucose 4-epimerase GalE [Eisenibacter elegans]
MTLPNTPAILVTGGAGFIGSHTVVSLIEAGFRPVIVDDFSNSSPNVIQRLEQITGKAIAYYTLDCLDLQGLKTVFAQETISGVIHFAAHKAVGESVQQPLKYYRNNLDSLLNVLSLMQEYQVQDLVFSSSATVYGQPDNLPVDEQAPLKPAESPYGFTKQVGEQILRDACKVSALRSVLLRYFNPIGAHPSGLIGELPLGPPNNLVPYIIQTAAGLRERLTVFGNDYATPDGTCIRDYIHVVDLAQAHVQALKHLQKQTEASYCEAFNIGTGKGNSVLEVIQTFIQETNQGLPYTIGPRRAGDVTAVYASVQKAEKQLDWHAERSLAQALVDAWRWQCSLK